MSVVAFRVDDVVQLRKSHPCGGFEWTVTRIGADIGLRCNTCAHRVMLTRPLLERRLKAFVTRGPDPDATPSHSVPSNGDHGQ